MKGLQDVAPTNLRPLLTLVGYLALCLTLPIFILLDISDRLRHAKRSTRTNIRLAIFSCLAIASLGSTWYHMFRFFARSYSDWASENSLPLPPKFAKYGDIVDFDNATSPLYLGQWLKDTQLFRQAWEAVIIGNGRWWWSQQIFLITMGWSVYLGRAGSEARVRRLWIYMLLGQIVAISYVMNLLFIAILASDQDEPPAEPKRAEADKRKPSLEATATAYSSGRAYLYSASIMLTLAIIYKVPSTVGTRLFLPMLLIPHLLLFLPVSLSGFARAKAGSLDVDFWTIIAFGTGLFIRTTYRVLQDSRYDKGLFLNELRSHPAVSSVGWDVVFCWLSTCVWLSSSFGESEG